MLSEQTKERVRYHMGYLGVANAAGFNLGLPAALQTQFMIEGAMNLVLSSAEPRLLKTLDRLDRVEQQIDDDAENLAVDSIDTIKINKDEFPQLVQRYMYWRGALANVLGVPPNEFDQRFGGYSGSGGGTGINMRVQH